MNFKIVVFVAWLTLGAIAATPAQSTEITFFVMHAEASRSMSPPARCILTFAIRNDSYGTIHRIVANIEATDVDGERISGVVSSVGNGSREEWLPIKQREISVGKSFASFEGGCNRIARLRIVSVLPEDCAIRMLPEEADCGKLVRLQSAVPGISISE
ncbi:hypothetical protein [Mesorhizobium sp.]|uniref:hypothetical protein n=1 Tax=Mesorhizobium sp. TaxID=1871066 RepID=UPI000FEA47FF|nr:hypothetical protein [Mesorhizobium sp.]RWP37996.1 MAG: hypothetical protein EOR03_03585 [Mesorhizobium sp.]